MNKSRVWEGDYPFGVVYDSENDKIAILKRGAYVEFWDMYPYTLQTVSSSGIKTFGAYKVAEFGREFYESISSNEPLTLGGAVSFTLEKINGILRRRQRK